MSVDVISRFGFKKDFGAVRSFGGGDGRHEFLDVSQLALLSLPFPRAHVGWHALQHAIASLSQGASNQVWSVPLV